MSSAIEVRVERRSFCVGALVGLASLGGCATIVRRPYLDLASAGQATALAAENITNKLALDYSRASVWDQVSATISEGKPPSSPLPASGSPDTPTSDAVQARAEEQASQARMMRLLSARATAFGSLAKAYQELALEVQYDARADMQGALDEAGKSLNAFGAVVAPSLAAVVLTPIVQATVPIAGGFLAQDRQRSRLRLANRNLAQISARFLALLTSDHSVFNQIADEISNSQVTAVEALISAGLVSPLVVINELALELGVASVQELPEDPTTARAVAVTVVREKAAFARFQQAGFFDAALKAFEALQKAHKEAEEAKEPDLVALTNSVLVLTDLAKRIRTLEGERDAQ